MNIVFLNIFDNAQMFINSTIGYIRNIIDTLIFWFKFWGISLVLFDIVVLALVIFAVNLLNRQVKTMEKMVDLLDKFVKINQDRLE